MIQVEHLSKTFEVKTRTGFFKAEKSRVEAVKDISLQIEKGKIIGLLGINGAGKTTTIKMLTTLLAPTGGTYLIDDLDAIKRPLEVKKIINMVAGGERMIYWRLTAYENLWYYGQIYGVPNELLKVRIQELIKLVGLEEKAHVPVETFSKGMKQRLQIARGLINDPRYLFMDEPTIGLDAVVAKELREHIRHLARVEGKGILLTSHYMGEVEELCDYIYLLNKGELIKQGTAHELATQTFTQKIFILKFYQAYPHLQEALEEKLKPYDQTIKVMQIEEGYKIVSESNIALQLSKVCLEAGWLVREMYEQAPHLEDTILEIAKEA